MSRGGGHSLENVQDGNQGPLQPWKDFYRMRRDEFRIRYKDISEEELYKWKHHDHGHEYTYL